MKKALNPRLVTALALLLCIATGTAQRTIIVDAAGGGDFTEIQPAVDAADPGDIVRVRHGKYLPVRISKGIRLLGDPPGDGTGEWVSLSGMLEVKDLPREETFVATDIGSVFATYNSGGFTATNCRGNIFLSHLGATGGIRIANCDFVSMHRCQIVGTGDSAIITDSKLVDVRSEFRGGNSGAGLNAIRSELILVDSEISGGWWFSSSYPGAILTDSKVTRSPGTRVVPGFSSGFPGSGIPTPTFVLHGSNSAWIAPHTVLIEDDTQSDQLQLRLQTGYVEPQVMIAGSLATRPIHLSAGRFFLDHASIQVLFSGISPISSERSKDLLLPAEFSPNIHKRDRNFGAAPPGSRWLGIPVTFQAAVTDRNGETLLSLPYTMVF